MKLTTLLIISTSTASALLVSTDTIIQAEKDFYVTQDREIVISKTGSYSLREFHYINMEGAFENHGVFSIDTTSSTKELTVALCYEDGSFINTNSVTINHGNNPLFTSYGFYYATIQNLGIMQFDTGAYQENYTPEVFIEGDVVENRGIIEVNNQSPSQGRLSMGKLVNTGILRLQNYKFIQEYEIVGNGCIYLDNGSELILEFLGDIYDQHLIMGDNSHIGFTNTTGHPYHISNFGPGKCITLVETSISVLRGGKRDSNVISYNSASGLLTLNIPPLKQHLFIGRGYDPDLFRINPKTGCITYEGSIPQEANNESICRVFPDDHEYHEGEKEEPSSTTYSTVISKRETTYTLKEEVITDDEGVWYTETHILEETSFTPTCTDNLSSIMAAVVAVKTDEQGNWHTTTSEVENPTTTSTYSKLDSELSIPNTEDKITWYSTILPKANKHTINIATDQNSSIDVFLQLNSFSTSEHVDESISYTANKLPVLASNQPMIQSSEYTTIAPKVRSSTYNNKVFAVPKGTKYSTTHPHNKHSSSSGYIMVTTHSPDTSFRNTGFHQLTKNSISEDRIEIRTREDSTSTSIATTVSNSPFHEIKDNQEGNNYPNDSSTTINHLRLMLLTVSLIIVLFS